MTDHAALEQECVVPADRPGPVAWRELPGLGWGTAVVLRAGAPTTLSELALEDDSHPGCIVAAEVALDGWTLTHDRSPRPWQLDHLFAGRALAFTSCRTVVAGGVEELSDHLPVVGVLRVR